MSNPTNATAILLCAGEGTRIREVTRDPKCLLEVAGKSIIRHQMESLRNLGVEKFVVVTGYRSEVIQKTVMEFGNSDSVQFIANSEYEVRGNSFSLLYGLQAAKGDVVILDGDLMFAPEILRSFLYSPEDAFLLGQGDIEDVECAKALVDANGYLRKLVDKRRLTEQELAEYSFAGEALGIIYLTDPIRISLVHAALDFLAPRENWGKNWEHLFSCFLPTHKVKSRFAINTRSIEIDTPEDYRLACQVFGEGKN